MAEKKSVDKKLVSLEDARVQLNLSEGGMRSWVIRRQIDVVHIGRRIMVKQATIDEIIERGTVLALDKKRPMSVVSRGRMKKAG